MISVCFRQTLARAARVLLLAMPFYQLFPFFGLSFFYQRDTSSMETTAADEEMAEF